MGENLVVTGSKANPKLLRALCLLLVSSAIIAIGVIKQELSPRNPTLTLEELIPDELYRSIITGGQPNHWGYFAPGVLPDPDTEIIFFDLSYKTQLHVVDHVGLDKHSWGLYVSLRTPVGEFELVDPYRLSSSIATIMIASTTGNFDIPNFDMPVVWGPMQQGRTFVVDSRGVEFTNSMSEGDGEYSFEDLFPLEDPHFLCVELFQGDLGRFPILEGSYQCRFINSFVEQ